MPEPLKNLYSTELVKSLGEQVSNLYGDFDTDGFSAHVIDSEWEGRELKERMKHISESLHRYLPMEYSDAIQILMESSSKFSGFQYMFFPGFVELYGLNKFEKSIQALEHFTKHSSSEFAVRPFIKKDSYKMMAQMQLWAKSQNHHVRRLASEGCRPRLPWAMALPEFKQDPSQILPILEKLKNDDSEYVRRSVANNLNDISKDNPQVVIDIAKSWLGNSQQTNRIVKHACRTLLKQGHPEIMNLFGFLKPEHIEIRNFTAQKSVEMGENLDFSFKLESQQQKLGKLRVEYAIGFVKKNGNRSKKMFKISESEINGNNKTVAKSHSFKKISTRKHYAGNHSIGIFVNGCELASMEFLLSEKILTKSRTRKK
ncbi:MAG: DNA alkylation repair protein [Candidatus Thioglobus sp.]|uniref:DNA alkylation repair protein n=1 Tax=Candidatus Thioglobus sp. TaxID=2026721 RepID=UPI002626EF4F|nr:DNA alkylation repair protein [Candidatus Thioglobus sp.]MDC9727676.1 DNA alkylation repair protein [Candidatus Thioglobus sp.]